MAFQKAQMLKSSIIAKYDNLHVKPDKGSFFTMLVLDMNAYAEKYGNKAVPHGDSNTRPSG